MGAGFDGGEDGGAEFPPVGGEEEVDCVVGEGGAVGEIGGYGGADWGGAVCGRREVGVVSGDDDWTELLNCREEEVGEMMQFGRRRQRTREA